MRGIDDRNILDTFCEDFCSIVEQFSNYVICSGFVAISSGRTRATEDIDLICQSMDFETFTQFFSRLEHNNFVCMQSGDPKVVFDYLTDNCAVRFTKKDEPLPEMEFKFSKDALDEYQIQTRVRLPLTGLHIWFSSIPMNIAFKEHLLKSEKDLKDAEHLRKIYPELVDESEIQKITKMIDEFRLS